jgi:hypothetical protein
MIRDSTFLATYRYELRHDTDSRPPLRLATQWGEASRVFSLAFDEAAGVTGAYATTGGVASVTRGSSFVADTSDATPQIGVLRSVVTADITTASTDEFAGGAWTVRFGTETVAVTVASGGTAGVNVSLDGGPAEFIAWQDFRQLFAPGSMAPAWQQAASASFQFLSLTLSQVETTFVALVDAARASFTSAAYARDCSAFPVSPPAGVLLQGERVMTWLGSADQGFDLRFADCWQDLAGDGRDYLYRGSAALSGWRAANDGRNRLVFVGFGGDAFGSRVPGGVGYRNLALDRTEAAPTGGHVLDPERSYTLSGGFALGFTEP